MTATATELHPCAGGCGEMVRGTWKRGHKARFEAHGTCILPESEAGRSLGMRLGLLPGPDADDDELDEFLDIVGPPLPPGSDTDLEDGEDEIRPDPPPRHVDPPGRGRPRVVASGHKVRVSATIRRDIQAKIRFMTVPFGELWAIRDPACGVTFVGQEPKISEALTDIICDSADLVAFFTGPAGGFMKYLNLAAALAPVGQMVYMHHVAHTIELQPVDRQTVNPAAYAA